MSNPSSPNFKPGVGRLVTDRYDFEKHIDGSSFRHNSSQIDLFSTLIVGSTPTHNVQDTLSALTAVVNSLPPSPPATTTTLGFIQINGDITGTATNIKVIGLQTKPVSNLPPTNNQVLTWDGYNGFWAPKTPTNFIAGGDLIGSNTNQQVVSLTGTTGTMNASFSVLNLTNILSSTSIGMVNRPSGAGQDFYLSAQSTNGLNQNGGNVNVAGGQKNGSGLRGGVHLRMNGALAENVLQLVEPVQNQRVLGLFSNSADVSSTNMPIGTGDMVMFIANAATLPTSGVPSGGCVVYSDGSSKLNILEPTGTQIIVGHTMAPTFTSGPTGAQTLYFTGSGTSVSTTPATLLSYTMPNNTALIVEAYFVGKMQGSVHAASYILRSSYLTNGSGAQVAMSSSVGTPVLVAGWGDLTGGTGGGTDGANWSPQPTITTSGSTVNFLSGGKFVTNINWQVTVRLTIMTAA